MDAFVAAMGGWPVVTALTAGGLMLLVAVVAMFLTFAEVREGEVVVMQRFGKYHAILAPGIHVLLPCVDAVHEVHWHVPGNGRGCSLNGWRLPTNERILDLPPVPLTTQDRLSCSVDIVVFYTIVDVRKAVYGTRDMLASLHERLSVHLRTMGTTTTLEQWTAMTTDALMRQSADEIKVMRQDLGVQVRLAMQRVTCDERIMRAAETHAMALRSHDAEWAQEGARMRTATARLENDTKLDGMAARRRIDEQRTRGEATATRLQHLIKACNGDVDRAMQAFAIDAWHDAVLHSEPTTVVLGDPTFLARRRAPNARSVLVPDSPSAADGRDS